MNTSTYVNSQGIFIALQGFIQNDQMKIAYSDQNGFSAVSPGIKALGITNIKKIIDKLSLMITTDSNSVKANAEVFQNALAALKRKITQKTTEESCKGFSFVSAIIRFFKNLFRINYSDTLGKIENLQRKIADLTQQTTTEVEETPPPPLQVEEENTEEETYMFSQRHPELESLGIDQAFREIMKCDSPEEIDRILENVYERVKKHFGDDQIALQEFQKAFQEKVQDHMLAMLDKTIQQEARKYSPKEDYLVVIEGRVVNVDSQKIFPNLLKKRPDSPTEESIKMQQEALRQLERQKKRSPQKTPDPRIQVTSEGNENRKIAFFSRPDQQNEDQLERIERMARRYGTTPEYLRRLESQRRYGTTS